MARPKGYDEEGYTHFIEKKTGETHWIGKEEKNNLRKMPDTQMYEVNLGYIEQLNLNKVGNEIVYTHSVWNVDRYMAYYWKQIMDADCIFLWHHLWEYCDKDNGVDMCYPKMKELQQRTGMSRGTLISKLRTLEDNNFIIKVGRLNKRNGNKEDSPIFKIRRTIPLLSKEQVSKLTPFMQEKHDEYMKNYASHSNLDWFARSGSETIDEIIENVGEKILTHKQREEAKRAINEQQLEDFLLQNLPTEMQTTLIKNEELKNKLIDGGYFSKPITDLYFDETMLVFEPNTLTAHFIVEQENLKKFFETSLTKDQQDRLNQFLIEIYENVYNIKFFTAYEYIISCLKSK